MAGHNKWSKIKRQKAATDAKKSKSWARITRDIMVAAREGGGDVNMNARLALAVEKAKGENMPKDNIERAIKRGTGEIAGADYEEVHYEGYGPGGVAIFVEALTDNINRTVADVRHLFNKHGGSMGQSGSVGYLFDRKGHIEFPAGAHDEMELFELVAEAGAEDLVQEENHFVVTTRVEQFGAVVAALNEHGIEPEEAGLVRIPTTTVSLDPEAAKKIGNLVELLEELQDVQAVYTTLELDDATIEALS